MSSLPNYLRPHRKRLALSQEEVGFLLGYNGTGKGARVCRDETFKREPSLSLALKYAVLYDRPVAELFAGRYQQAQRGRRTRQGAGLSESFKAKPKNSPQTTGSRQFDDEGVF